MAKIDVIMPQMGESIAEGTLSRWIKKLGDPVKRDEPIFEISTDKVDAEIPAPAAGVLAEILVTGRSDRRGPDRGGAIETEAGAAAAQARRGATSGRANTAPSAPSPGAPPAPLAATPAQPRGGTAPVEPAAAPPQRHPHRFLRVLPAVRSRAVMTRLAATAQRNRWRSGSGGDRRRWSGKWPPSTTWTSAPSPARASPAGSPKTTS